MRHTLSRHPASGEILYYAVWSPDGQRLAAGRRRNGRGELFWQNADGSGPGHVLYSSDALLMPGSWSADGRHLAFTVDEQDIWVVDPDDATPKPRALIATHAIEDQAEFSPDGRWLAYVSDDSGGEQVYVQPFPGPGPRKQMSVDGGTAPAWNPTGRELFYATPREPARDRHMMMVVDVKTTPELSLGTPRPLFEINRPGVTGPNIRCQPVRCYDVMPNGQQFLAIQLPPGGPVLPPPVTHINLVQNWFEELRTKVPLGR
ncbi:MAG: PD40 domain-containing protein [Acidobacteria bacterium]|nr:PD40 domain-containing protein [Acidobacteriota bacterium]